MRTRYQHRRSRSPRLLRVELLEDRAVPAAYTLTVLGGSPGISAVDINEAGHIVGSATIAGQTHAVLWRDGMMIDLGTLGGIYSAAGGLNDAGQVVGTSRIAAGSITSDSFLWENGGMTGLGITVNQGTFGTDVNDAGQVVGAWYDGHYWRAFLWDDGVVREPFAGKAAEINDAGQIAGEWESTRGYPVAAIWDPVLGPRELGVFPGGVFSGAAAINDLGQVVGYSESINGDRAVLWENGQMIDLGPGGAADINNVGQIVGGTSIWRDGVRANLSDLVMAGSGLTLWNVSAINDAGQIVGSAFDAQGVMHAVLLNPIPNETPLITVNDVTVTEGHTGTQTAAFTVTLSTASNAPVTVAFATANGTATAGSDYQARSEVVTFAPGQTTATVAVLVNGDRAPEPHETFVVTLNSATGGAVILDGHGAGTIMDDEPRIAINDVSCLEGNQGQTTLFTFTVTLSAPYDQPVTVSFRTANDTARSSKDYVARSGTLTFNPGETAKTITIEVIGNNRRENTKRFFLDLFGNSGNSLFTRNRGIGMILNDD